MTRRCPAAAYLSTMSGQSSSLNTTDLEPTRSMDHRKAFLRDMVDFMYRCHGYVKKAKEGHPGKEFKLCDNEKKDYLQELLSIIAQREKESRAIQFQKSIPDTGQSKSKIRFDPRGKSTPVSSYAGQTQLTGSPVSAISNLADSRDYQTPPRVYKSSQGSTGFSSMMAQLPYGVSSSSASTDAGSPEMVSRRPQAPCPNRVCGVPGQDLSSSYSSYSSYPCPYKARSYMASYGSSRGQPSINSQYTSSPAYTSSYQRPYAPSSVAQNATAQTSFYEYARGGEPVEYYEGEYEVDMNSAFIAEDDVNEYEEDVQDVPYGSYVSRSGTVICACK